MPSGKEDDDADINRANANRKKDGSSDGTSILKNLIYGKTPKANPKKGSNQPKKKT